jgi:hypothetical protein
VRFRISGENFEPEQSHPTQQIWLPPLHSACGHYLLTALYYRYPMIQLELHRGSLFRLEKHRKFRPQNAWLPLFGRRPESTVFLICLSGFGKMQSSFVQLFYLTSKGISATASVGRRFEVSTSISIVHQLTMPSGRGKRLPEPKPPGSCIRLILLMLYRVTSSCSAT